jgi:quinol-cytochrome oxidoreductase complex cytochrome b subunit
MFGLFVFLIFYAFFVFYAPNLLGEAVNYVPANPLVTPDHIVPEWYLLPFYAILRAIPNKLLGVIAMFASILILLILPWLDTSKVRSAKFRPVYFWFFWVFLLDTLLLGWCGAQKPEGIVVWLSLLGTIWYFGHFLVIMPLLGWLERPLPLPTSISAAVLGGSRPVPAGAPMEKP